MKENIVKLFIVMFICSLVALYCVYNYNYSDTSFYACVVMTVCSLFGMITTAFENSNT